MSDLLKEAIADAKAVRETALQNAKAALEEAFTPQLKSMLTAKLKEDDDDGDVDIDIDAGGDDDDEDEGEDGEAEEGMLGTAAGAGLGAMVGGPVGAAMGGMAGDAVTGEDEEAEEGEMEPEEGTYEDEEAEEGMHEEDNLDLEAVIRELEQEIAEGEHDEDEEGDAEEGMHESEEPVEEEYEIDENTLSEDEDEDDDKEEVDEEVDTTSGIGSGTGRGSTDKSSGIGTGGQEKSQKMESVQAELAEYKEAVTYLKDKLHEVNILNAKLLYTNKLFKEFSLDNNQKLKVVETFDRAQTTREIKLVYSTIAEQLNENTGITKRKSIKESASTAVSSTKPSKESTKVISEESEVADRFKKLAGIIKG